jgi:hypothetical protein
MIPSSLSQAEILKSDSGKKYCSDALENQIRVSTLHNDYGRNTQDPKGNEGTTVESGV